MPDTTLGITYPSLTDAPEGPSQLQTLAEDVDALIAADRTLRDADVSNWSPTFAGSSSGGTIGNAVHNSKYIKRGRQVWFWTSVVFGTTTSMGSGTLLISLPVAGSSDFDQDFTIGGGLLIDASTSARKTCVPILNTSTTMILAIYDGVLVASGSGSPWTWTTSDVIRVHGTYLAASA